MMATIYLRLRKKEVPFGQALLWVVGGGIVMSHHLSKHRRDLMEVKFIQEEERRQEKSRLRRIAEFFRLC